MWSDCRQLPWPLASSYTQDWWVPPDAFQPWLHFRITGVYKPISQTSFYTNEPIRISGCKIRTSGLSKSRSGDSRLCGWLRAIDPGRSYSPQGACSSPNLKICPGGGRKEITQVILWCLRLSLGACLLPPRWGPASDQWHSVPSLQNPFTEWLISPGNMNSQVRMTGYLRNKTPQKLGHQKWSYWDRWTKSLQ